MKTIFDDEYDVEIRYTLSSNLEIKLLGGVVHLLTEGELKGLKDGGYFND
jgi:hypothetical protein